MVCCILAGVVEGPDLRIPNRLGVLAESLPYRMPVPRNREAVITGIHTMSGSDPLSLKAPYSLAAMDHEGVIRLFHLTTVKGLTAVAQVVARLMACL